MSFKYAICLDFEETCWQNNSHLKHAEIIEIGACLLNIESGEKEDQFHCYIRPTHRSRLSRFCVKLTGIKQKLLDCSEAFPTSFKMFTNWVETMETNMGLRYTSLAGICATDDGPNTTLCTWSNTLLEEMLPRDCERSGVTCPSYLKAWINVYKQFEKLYPKSDPQGFSQALTRVHITQSAWEHSALCDATHLAELVAYLTRRGLTLSTANESSH